LPSPLKSATASPDGPGLAGRTGGGRECSIAVSKQNGDRAVAVVGDSEIQLSAVMEVGGQNSLRPVANGYRRTLSRSESPAAVTEKGW